MNEPDLIFNNVEYFLADQRKKLDEDRKTVNLVLSILNDEQQVFSRVHRTSTAKSTICNDFSRTSEENSDQEEPVTFVKTLKPLKCTKKTKTYNSQAEKERLACLFENSPNFLCFRNIPKKYICNENAAESDLKDKENQNPCSRISEQYFQNNNNVRRMVRVGEFSPVNPSFNSSDRSLLGLGEYEERRRAFLEKKKQEYAQYLANMKKNRKLQRLSSNQDEATECSALASEKSSPTLRKIFTPDRGLIEVVDFNNFTKLQQEDYRKELDRQIEEKKKLKDERKNREKLEYQRSQCNDTRHRRDVMKHIEDEFTRRLKVLNECKYENDARNKYNMSDQKENTRFKENLSNIREKSTIEETSGRNSPFAKQSIETCSIENPNAYEKMKKELYKRELGKQIEEKRQLEEQRKINEERKEHQANTDTNSRIPHYLGNPFMKQSAESCSIDNLEEYKKMKHEIYKRELAKQIEEKRKLQEERKAKTEEADRKLEEKFKKNDEIRMKEEYEREQALRDYYTIQKVQEVAYHAHAATKNNLPRIKHSSKPPLKSKNVSPTDYKFNEKTSVKNVTFAPRTCIYNIADEPASKSTMSVGRTECKNNSIIIDAPYTLAVKNATVNNCGREQQSSPPINKCLPIPPDLREPLPEIGNLPIPSAVSMSDQAIRDYFKTNAFSDLSQIRRMLRERQANSN